MTATTAGSDKQSILGRLYDDALRSDHREDVRPGFIRIADPDKRFLMHWYEAPAEMPAEEPDTWRSAHPASWIDEDAVRAQRNDPSIGDDEFERQWLNRWTKSSHSWFKTDVWKRNGPPAHPAEAIPAPGPIFVGIDGAWSDDCTALVWAYPVSLDEIHLRAHIWGTRDDLEGQYHTFVPGGTMDMELVRAKIHALAERYKVREIAYDPKFFTDTAHRLSDDGFTMVDFPRSGPVYGAATQDFYRLVNGFGARHDGDEAFASHIESTAAVQTEGGWKIMKLKQSRKIDATPAAIMAVSRAKTYIEKGAVSYAFSGRKKENDAT
jgi:phage terminase large subunit-like protein